MLDIGMIKFLIDWFSWYGGALQFVEVQCVIKQYALYVICCFATYWCVACCTDPPSLGPSGIVCITNLVCLSVFFLVCFDDLVIFVWCRHSWQDGVFVICWSTVYYKTVCLVWSILFCNLLMCSVLHGPTCFVAIGHRMHCLSWLSALLVPSWLPILFVCQSFFSSALMIWSFLCDVGILDRMGSL